MRWLLRQFACLTAAVGLLGVGIGGGAATDIGIAAPKYRFVRPPVVALFRELTSGRFFFDVVVRLNRPLPRSRHEVLSSILLGTVHSRHPQAYDSEPVPMFRVGRVRGHCYEQGGIQTAIPRRLRKPKVGQAVTVELIVQTGGPVVFTQARLVRENTRPFWSESRIAHHLGC